MEELEDVRAVLDRAGALDVVHWSLVGASSPESVQQLDALAKDKPVVAAAMDKMAVNALKDVENIVTIDMVAKGQLWTGPEARHGKGLDWEADVAFRKKGCPFIMGLGVWQLLDQRWAMAVVEPQ